MHFDTDDIVFGSTSPSKVQEFVNQMKEEFEMSIVGELNFFLGLKVKETKNGIFISQSKYAKNLEQRLDLEKASILKPL